MSLFELWQCQVVLYYEFLLAIVPEGSSTQFKTKLALIGFILWESENQHSLSTVVKCQRPGRFIVNVQKALFWRKLLFSLTINITNNTNFYHLKN